MSQVYIAYSGDENEHGSEVFTILGVFADKQKAIEEVKRNVRSDPSITVTDEFVNGVEQSHMFWIARSWQYLTVGKVEVHTLIDWE